MTREIRRVLVTGGAGFIGSHICDLLAEAGYEVIILDNLSTGTLDNVKHLLKRDNVKFVRGDILDMDCLMRVMKNIDAVLHQAAQLEIATAVNDPITDLRVNVEGTINVLEAMRRCGVKRMIFASSAAVYGEPVYVPQDEDHPKNPNWQYGASKLACEHYLKVYHNLYGIRSVALRYGIVYGPREWYGRVLTVFIKRVVLENKPPVIFGDGRQTRDFVHVRDVARACKLVLEQDDYECEVYNVSSGRETSILDLARLVIEASGVDFEPVFEDVKEGEYSKLVGVWRKPKELRRMWLDIARITKRYGWRPEISLRDGIREEIEWIKENPERWAVKPRI